MHWITGTEAMTLQTLLALVLSASLLTSAQSRVVVVNGNNSGDSSEETSSSSSSSSPNSSLSVDHHDNYVGDHTEGYGDWPASSDSYDEDYEEDEEDYFYENLDMWPVLCPPNTFYSLEKDDCTTCTPCPANTLMFKTCHRFDDNICLPITSFRSSGEDANNVRSGGHSRKTSVSDNNSNEWKSVSLTLLIFTSVTCLCLVSVGAVFCYLKRRAHTATVTKEILCIRSPAPRFPIVKVAEV